MTKKGLTKKGQGISINTIIIAAIALAVLVVLFAIFTGRLGLFSKGVQEIDSCAQKCKSINMGFAGGFTSEPTVGNECNNAPGQIYISGSYKEGKYGCCCR